jgi:hypothetical protein
MSIAHGLLKQPSLLTLVHRYPRLEAKVPLLSPKPNQLERRHERRLLAIRVGPSSSDVADRVGYMADLLDDLQCFDDAIPRGLPGLQSLA